MRRVVLLLVGALALGACGGGSVFDGTTSPGESTLSPTTLPMATTSEPPSTVGALPTLWLGISIHVEGWKEEDTNQGQYDRHRAGLTELAEVAAAHDARLTFELSQVFMDGHEAWGDTFIDDMVALGHGFGIHADLGGGDPPFRVFVDQLTARRSQLETMGAEVVHVSGICSGSPWVEAAIEAGYLATTGAVEYCLTSLDVENIPEGKEHVVDCSSPGECHGASVDDLVTRMHPWRTSTAADWLRPDPAGGLWVIVGESGSSLDCLSETDTGPGCIAEQADIDLFIGRLDDYLAAVGSRDAQGILSISWSIGSLPTVEFAEAFLSAIDPYVADGRVVWHSIDDMTRLLADG